MWQLLQTNFLVQFSLFNPWRVEDIKLDNARLSEDRLLGGRVRFRQPAGGYRVGSDSVLLASAVPAVSGSRVLDLGAGVGAASLCLAVRVPGCQIDAVELQPELADIAVCNAGLNNLNSRMRLHVGNIASLPSTFFRSFDHVMVNPPYLPANRDSRGSRGNLSKVEAGARLSDWVSAASSTLRTKGSLTFIHRSDRLDELLALIRDVAGEIVVAPLWSHRGKAARRILVRARKGSSTPLRLVAGLTLHDDDGGYTTAAEAIFRNASAFTFSSDGDYSDSAVDFRGDGWTVP